MEQHGRLAGDAQRRETVGTAEDRQRPHAPSLGDGHGGVLEVAPADGHGALDNAPCAATAIDTYLATGTLPSTTDCQQPTPPG
jgi:hypothetical protein